VTKILIVDDRAENLVALAAVLEPLPAQVVTASSGEEALRLLLEEDFAAVLLDVQMPGMDGFETAEYAKKLERTRYTPIIFLTARDADAENVFRGYETGAVDFVVKPYEPEILRSKVAVFVELHEKTAALEASERRFKSAFEDAPIGVGLVGPDGRWLAVNRSLCTIAGLPAGTLVGTEWRAVLDPADAGQVALPAPGEAAHSAECRWRRPDGSQRWVLTSASAVRDPDGSAPHHLLMANDVTARREAEERAARMAAQALVHETERAAQAEIAAAHRTLLQTLLPTPPPSLPVRAFYRPGDARLLLGGDFYDGLVDDRDRLRIVLGDVSGHGPAAAGLSAALRVAWRALATSGKDDDELLASLQRVLAAERPDPDMFATICCATLTGEPRVFEFVSAGHPAPIILGNPPRAVDIEAAPPLGVLPSGRWPVHRVTLAPGEGALLYTDGLIEGRVAHGAEERFGTDRLVELLAARGLAQRPEELEAVIREIAEIGGGLPDDVAALIVLPATRARSPRRAATGAARGG
jgi:PAS domain S-box-containing protein